MCEEVEIKKEKRKINLDDLYGLAGIWTGFGLMMIVACAIGYFSPELGIMSKYISVAAFGRYLGEWFACIEEEEYKALFDDKKNCRIANIIFYAMCIFVFFQLQPVGGFSNYYLMFLSGILSISFFIDMKIQELPDLINATFLVMTIILFILYVPQHLLTAVILAIILTIPYAVMGYFGGLGFGDVKLLFPISMLYALSSTTTLYIADQFLEFWSYTLIATFIYLVPMVVYNIVKNKPVKGIKFAFGPFIIIGFFVLILGLFNLF